MFSNTMCKSFLAAAIMIVAACDEMAEEQALALDEQAEAAPQDRQKTADAPEELAPDAAPAWSELDITDAPQGVEGPDGKTCCADCGDGWAGWYNLGGADNCNGRAAAFCGQNGWYFINAEWRYAC
ncbi:MAG TPA: hypothetical protein VGB85_24975 [Nannocystis sp.]|jgi:hypothetical protein